MRLIDADELLKKMDIAIAMLKRTMIAFEIEDDAEAQMELKAYKDIRNGINDEPTVHPESNWISCKERLPDVGAILLSDGNEIVIGEYYGDNTWKVDGCDYDPILEEIAWMPLPEPYKPEEERL